MTQYTHYEQIIYQWAFDACFESAIRRVFTALWEAGADWKFMILRDEISAATKEAMKAKDSLTLSTLRLVSAAVKDRDIAARSEDRCGGIDDGEILSLLVKMVKQREESAKVYEDNARPELAEQERSEIEVIRRFMPKAMDEAEMETAVAAAVEACGGASLKDMGKIMGGLKRDYAGRMDMGKAGKLVKAHLTN